MKAVAVSQYGDIDNLKAITVPELAKPEEYDVLVQ